jgi:hypothetical protein
MRMRARKLAFGSLYMSGILLPVVLGDDLGLPLLFVWFLVFVVLQFIIFR